MAPKSRDIDKSFASFVLFYSKNLEISIGGVATTRQTSGVSQEEKLVTYVPVGDLLLLWMTRVGSGLIGVRKQWQRTRVSGRHPLVNHEQIQA